ncbi:MAG: sigma-70 family RNA polymerase sigma factor [Crocinitomix sp.]|nr:sigma-70 family RNA polymerase sigma factor [Crocinitomix sp.]
MTTEHVWNDFKGELFGFIKSRINDHELAEDLLQEVFIKIHMNLKGLTEGTNLASWIYRITRNTIIDSYRKKKWVVYQETIEEKFPEESTESTQDLSKCLTSFVKELSEKDQDLLNKTAFGSMSQKEYAASLNLGYSAVKSRSQRAKEKLKNLFVACCAIQTDTYGNVLDADEKDCDC